MISLVVILSLLSFPAATGGKASPSVSREGVPLSQSGYPKTIVTKDTEYMKEDKDSFCNPNAKKLREAKGRVYQPNGLICPTCSSDSSSSCNPSDTVQCRGDENMCFVWTRKGRGYRANLASQGCTRKSFCHCGILSQHSDGTTYKEMTTCTKASNPIKPRNFDSGA